MTNDEGPTEEHSVPSEPAGGANQSNEHKATAPGEQDARVAYQVAVSLWTYEGTTIWSRYNAMLVANSLILVVVGFALAPASQVPAAVEIILPMGGLFICLGWHLSTKRSFDYYRYWILAAREIEDEHMSAAASIVAKGGRFAEGQTVELRIGGAIRRLQMGRAGRLLRIAWIAYAIIGVFAIIHAILLLSTLLA